MANKLLINYVLEYLLSTVFPFPFFKAFKYMFCYLAITPPAKHPPYTLYSRLRIANRCIGP